MPEPTAQLRKQLGLIRLKLLPEDYFFIQLPPDAKAIPGEWYGPATTRFAAFVRDAEAITLIVARQKWLGMRNLFPKFWVSKKARVIRLDLRRLKDPTHYVPTIGRTLVEAGIVTAPMASLHALYVLVAREDLPKAIRVLRGLFSGEPEPGSPLRGAGAREPAIRRSQGRPRAPKA